MIHIYTLWASQTGELNTRLLFFSVIPGFIPVGGWSTGNSSSQMSRITVTDEPYNNSLQVLKSNNELQYMEIHKFRKYG